MSRAPFQVLIFPYRMQDNQEPLYAIFKRSDSNYWQGIAGGGESNETPIYSAKREANEEAGIPKESDFIKLCSCTFIPATDIVGKFLWGTEHLVIPEYAFGVKVNSKNIILSNEHTECKWLTYQQAKDCLRFDSNKTALWELNERLRNGQKEKIKNKKHRIRVAAIIVNQKQEVLLVQHIHPQTRYEWWVPPGGGLEDSDLTIFDCAKREVFEESGLTVNPERVIYLREFQDEENEAINLEIFTIVDSFQGELTIQNIQGHGADEHYIQNVKWFSENEIKRVNVFPEILSNEFWKHLKEKVRETKYLGRQIG